MSDWDNMDFGKEDMLKAYLYLAMLVGMVVGVPIVAIVLLLVWALVG